MLITINSDDIDNVGPWPLKRGYYAFLINSLTKYRVGRFEAADKGTIFLDEIGETSENFQVKLLRVIQSGDFEKVGSSKTSHVDIKIIAATNKNLEKEVRAKLKLFLKNIENDVLKLDTANFEQVKLKFSSKYKNLPQKFHSYLDEIIKHKLK